MQKPYQKLCAEFYNQSKPRASEKEIAFYSEILNRAGGPFLEAMCGSGRLTVPLLEKGFSIDGVDDSVFMLNSLQGRCAAKSVQITLFNQPLQELSIPKKYGLIFIAIGSFGLITERDQAVVVLKKLHDHLLPGGCLLLEMDVPWNDIKNSIVDGMSRSGAASSFGKKVAFPDSSEILYKGVTIVYLEEQLEIFDGIYEKIFHGRILETEKERLVVRWYHRYEMQLLLERCGFSQVRVWDESFELNPQAAIYQAFSLAH
jgi:SAM-dependent methyltransferase